MLATVPGTVAGMHIAWQRFSSARLKWSELIAPAICAAREGYTVTNGLATTLWLERDRFAKYESSRGLFFRDGKPLVAGDTIRNADLAHALELHHLPQRSSPCQAVRLWQRSATISFRCRRLRPAPPMRRRCLR